MELEARFLRRQSDLLLMNCAHVTLLQALYKQGFKHESCGMSVGWT